MTAPNAASTPLLSIRPRALARRSTIPLGRGADPRLQPAPAKATVDLGLVEGGSEVGVAEAGAPVEPRADGAVEQTHADGGLEAERTGLEAAGLQDRGDEGTGLLDSSGGIAPESAGGLRHQGCSREEASGEEAVHERDAIVMGKRQPEALAALDQVGLEPVGSALRAIKELLRPGITGVGEAAQAHELRSVRVVGVLVEQLDGAIRHRVADVHQLIEERLGEALAVARIAAIDELREVFHRISRDAIRPSLRPPRTRRCTKASRAASRGRGR